MSTLEGSTLRQPVEGDWPEADLEHLGKCPVCGETARSVLFEGLRDKVFFCAPGVWTMWRCAGCRVGYVDPRPTQTSIGRAYETYYTHSAGAASHAGPKSFVHKLRRAVANSYLNKEFGHRLKPSLPFGWLLMRLQPARALSTAYHYRHLPAPSQPDDCLLDIGCGNGTFLKNARDDLGVNVEGLEIDPRAVQAAVQSGLKVHAGLVPGSGLEAGRYYAITMSHVLEHLHDPLAALREIYCLLKPGGWIWICVPNLAASSIGRFGKHSRLLEPPRHLVMFDTIALKRILALTGFTNLKLENDYYVGDFVYRQSLAIENGLNPNIAAADFVEQARTPLLRHQVRGPLATLDAEYITLTAIQPL